MATIEIDGNTVEVENGKMIIEVADEQGVYIPRFCYHKKLSVAANCRMCLVEVENARKTVPACATPVNDGMKIFTKSKAARESQEAVMEFLLINHPLDCPICDQGGECELQDISLGFGKDESKYTESKRSVSDDDLGDLISTEMTRCIQCTRCVRFCDEVAGLPELGGIGRGENMQISTYVQHNMQSEVSGNIIDLCPVGALTSKPYRYTARAWEMVEYASIAPHDCLGSNVLLHTRRNEVMRAVPNEKEEINETWLSDRDRFSYLGLNSKNRLSQPMIKNKGKWQEASWQEALDFAASGIMRVLKEHGPQNMAAFSSPSATLEEGYLLQKIMRTFGIENLDHRLQQVDFNDQDLEPNIPDNSLAYAELENQTTICVVGCNIDKEIPLLGIRVRKANINGGTVSVVNPADYAFKLEVTNKAIVAPQNILHELLKILVAATTDINQLSTDAQKLVLGIEADATARAIAESLKADKAAIVIGAIAENNPNAALIRTATHLISQSTGAKIVRLSNGANSAGLKIAGMLPNRGPAGHSIEEQGLHAQDAIASKLKGYILHAVEPDFDFTNPHATRQAMLAAEFVISLTAYDTEGLRECCDVMLPVAPYAETSGTFINIDGNWQSFKGAVKPHAEARPAWKVLRVLGNVLKCDGFEYNSSEDVLTEVKSKFTLMTDVKRDFYYPESLPAIVSGLCRIGEWPLYRLDSVVRQADALQNCGAAQKSEIRVNSAMAKKYKLTDNATVSQGDIAITLPLTVDDRIADDAVWVANAMPETVDLGHAYSSITIK